MPTTGGRRRPVIRRTGGSSALSRALRFEKNGKRYYARAAGMAADPFAAEIFRLLAGLEEQHMKDIAAIARALGEQGKFPAVSTAPNDARMKMFDRELRRIRKETLVTGESPDAVRKALGMEAEGREMYRRMAREAKDPQERRFFDALSGEEEKHFELLYEYVDFLEERGLRMQDG